MLGTTLKQRYKLTRILGAGGFGQTYLAIDTQSVNAQAVDPQAVDLQAAAVRTTSELPSEACCVVKQLKPASQDKTFLTVARRLFNTESDTLKKLGAHPQIPRAIDFFEEDSEFYLVQEYIDGQSLEDEIEQVGRLSEAQAIALLEDVLPVLHFIHSNNVVHRDLKPDNLIRQRSDGKVALIDFGAVKQIRTTLITGERTNLTIGIGTQGYTPSEQLAGKPRYSSDIYALGMTIIHALTGKSPTDLPEAAGSLEPLWQDYADVSPGFAILLDKMTRHYIQHRYQSVDEVQRDLKRLDALPAEAASAPTYIETAMPQRLASSEAKTVIVRWRMRKRAKLLTVAISTLVTSACMLGLRQVGAFVSAELAVWDNMVVNMQPDKGPDPRLLIVEIKEEDLPAGSYTPTDGALAQAIDNLQSHTPARIAVDLLRPPSVETSARSGIKSLRESLKDPNVLVVTRLSDPDRDNTVPPPPGMLFEQLSFSNVVADRDFRVRRSLMLDFLDDSIVSGPSGEHLGVPIGNGLANDPTEQPIFSLGTEAAIHYLEMYEGLGPAEGEILQIGNVRFEPITPSFGGYQDVDNAGYQTFIRYRSPHDVAARISFSDVLNNRFDPALVKDKIVLIGATGANSRDVFLTPYNTGDNDKKMHGVEVHAQVASQILTAVIDGETVPWAWPDAVEVAWIVALTGIGSGLMVLTQKGPILILFGVGGLALACAVSVVSFELGGWVPMVAPMSAFFFSAAGARISKSYQRRYWEAKQSDTELNKSEES